MCGREDPAFVTLAALPNQIAKEMSKFSKKWEDRLSKSLEFKVGPPNHCAATQSDEAEAAH